MTLWRRERGQVYAIAAVAMIAMLGAVSMVIDAGVFFVIQRQLQNTADAAVLAAVWYDPACPKNTWDSYGCQPSNANPPQPECAMSPNVNDAPCNAAADSVKANWSVALALCAGPKSATGTVQIAAGPGILTGNGSLNVPTVQPYVVTLTCNAPHWFAQVLPGVLPTMTISASASAALGWLGPNGQLLGDPRPVSNPPLVARLLIPS